MAPAAPVFAGEPAPTGTASALNRALCLWRTGGWYRLDTIENRLHQSLRQFNGMQARPIHATAFFAQVLEGFRARFVGASQIQSYMNQGVLGGNVRVYGEQRFVAGIAAAEGASRGAGKRWIGDYFLHHWKMLLIAATNHYHVNGWRLYARW
ncbi:hypothetical protein X970_26015 [Pseudomonas monteilii SB3101]|uniref:Uncharacterized protein n=1 Tax=Pseudomonas monteilii SB3101 TaxID=1435058 RepID=V9VBC3_9PSED|nr:hypothetical protein X969_26405 [Pseudomonas monteilii SB3078]AHC91200.1 hypothetical protein X970_26015 [Pseudomonas monteilii SB3101]KGK28357.1 hypothetical protein GT93_27030 [Pseudomonas plecoglossicida]